MKDATQFHIRPARPEEAGLFYTPHPEEDKRLGTIGHVRMDFGRSGNEFWHTWWPRGPEELNSPAFKLELQEVVDTLRGACELLRNLDNYQRITEGAYGYGQQRLQETLGLDDEAIYELDGYMDFEKYGQDCMENDCVTKTEFGLLRRLDPPFPEQRQGQQMFR